MKKETKDVTTRLMFWFFLIGLCMAIWCGIYKAVDALIRNIF